MPILVGTRRRTVATNLFAFVPQVSTRKVLVASMDQRYNWRLVGQMMLTVAVLVAITGTFALTVALTVRLVALVLFGGDHHNLLGAALSYRPRGLSPWLTIGAPTGLTVAVFAGLVALDRWRRRLILRRFQAGLREPPAGVQRTLSNLSQIARVPTPTVRVADAAVPTSFTTGLRTESASITVTTGLLEQLSEEEIRAVLAHELSHVKNRDVGVMTAVMVPVVIAEGLWTITTEDDRGDHPSSTTDRSTRSAGGFEGVFAAVIGIAAGLFWIVARLMTAQLARYRELAADRGAAAVTGSPSSVAVALQTLDGDGPVNTDLRAVGIEAFAVAPLTKDANTWATGWQTPLEIVPTTLRRKLESALQYHPETERRVRRLQEIEGKS